MGIERVGVMNVQMEIDIMEVLDIAIRAGKEIMKVYNTDFSVESKEDDSPLTLADKKSHHIIVEGLQKYAPSIPILSEEGKHHPYYERKEWSRVWIVDPLDGTKEFVKRNGEFTVNIALVENGNPILGVVYAPALDVVYIGKKRLGAYKIEGITTKCIKQEQISKIGEKLPTKNVRNYCSVVASRSHLSKETEMYINSLKEKYGRVEMTSAGSSLKLCLVAEGKADVYPRFAPTMEWDTSAGQAVVECAGGTVLQANNDQPLRYNKEDLLNPWFIATNMNYLRKVDE